MSTQGNEIKQPKSELTRIKIADTFLELITHKKWDKITVKEICGEADITRGTFYQYFNDIYDLMEQIQKNLLDDLTARYEAILSTPKKTFPWEDFVEKFDYTPPESLITWFRFCNDRKPAISALLDPAYGDEYFCKKLKNKLNEYINDMMDHDDMKHDALRDYFAKVFLELHFLVARTWVTSENNEFLTQYELIQLINSMRVGANYLTFKNRTTTDFDEKMWSLDLFTDGAAK